MEKAADLLRRALETRKVTAFSQRDATELEKSICSISPDSCKVMKVEKIPIAELSNFLDDLQNCEGIDNC